MNLTEMCSQKKNYTHPFFSFLTFRGAFTFNTHSLLLLTSLHPVYPINKCQRNEVPPPPLSEETRNLCKTLGALMPVTGRIV